MAAARLTLFRLLPVLFVAAGAMTYIAWVEGDDGFIARNLLPVALLVLLALVTLLKGGGSWTGAGWRWPLGTLGFAIPALGLTLYLHYGFAADLDGMVSDAPYPRQLFRFLPAYTTVAGAIGFAIGWIAGRNV
ncbi:MAG: hypothetical protein KJO31_07020 [Gammaproteobacteria bacterium]|nr:hypothetical protein [Gammaproteobacteria bacterium]